MNDLDHLDDAYEQLAEKMRKHNKNYHEKIHMPRVIVAWLMDNNQYDVSAEEVKKLVEDKTGDFLSCSPGMYPAIHMFKTPEAVSALLDAFPAQVNLRSKVTETPLMTQSVFGRLEIVKVLLERGGIPNAGDYSGKTVLKYAETMYFKANKEEIVNLLKKAVRNWTTACFTCKKVVPSLQKCTACNRARYCSVTCQKADWKAKHKLLCVSYRDFIDKPPMDRENCCLQYNSMVLITLNCYDQNFNRSRQQHKYWNFIEYNTLAI